MIGGGFDGNIRASWGWLFLYRRSENGCWFVWRGPLEFCQVAKPDVDGTGSSAAIVVIQSNDVCYRSVDWNSRVLWWNPPHIGRNEHVLAWCDCIISVMSLWSRVGSKLTASAIRQFSPPRSVEVEGVGCYMMIKLVLTDEFRSMSRRRNWSDWLFEGKEIWNPVPRPTSMVNQLNDLICFALSWITGTKHFV